MKLDNMKGTSIIVLLTLTSLTYGQSHWGDAFNLVRIWLEAQCAYDHLPGLSVSITHDQDVVWQDAFGYSNRAEGHHSTPQTLGSICSISKLFTSVAIMKLYEDDKLRLDDRVEDILPWFTVPQQFEISGPITVRTLLTHSSGLPREANAPYWTGPDFPFPSQSEIRDGLKDQETLYPASTYFQYSNLALTLLGEIVEKVSGQSYQSFVQQEILDPLGMNQTYTAMPQDLHGNQLAVGYTALNRECERTPVKLFDANGINAAAGFASNVVDLAKFSAWQFRLRDTTQHEILRPSTLKYMHQVHWVDPDWKTTWGLGFAVYQSPQKQTWISHGGSCPGYRSVWQMNPKEELAYAVMINASGTDPGKYARGIHAILMKANADQKEDKEEINFSDYTGFYNGMPWTSEIYLTPWYGDLAMVSFPTENPAENLVRFKMIDKDVFQRIRNDDNLGETLTFERDDAGRITRCWRNGNYLQKIVSR